jgi:hypothetical protein
MVMKILAMGLLIISASQVFANPIKLEGNFSRGNVIPMSKISYEIVNTPEQAKKFQNEGYTCKRVTNRYSCKKLENITEMPAGPEMVLKNQAPLALHFAPTADDYSEDFKSDSYTEWSRNQQVQVDDKNFDTIIWRELHDGPAKIILKDSKITLEFLVQSYDLGSVQHQRYTDPHTKKSAEYWGIVKYLKYETPDTHN